MKTTEMVKILKEMQVKISDRNIGANTAVYYILRTYGENFFGNVAKRLNKKP